MSSMTFLRRLTLPALVLMAWFPPARVQGLEFASGSYSDVNSPPNQRIVGAARWISAGAPRTNFFQVYHGDLYTSPTRGVVTIGYPPVSGPAQPVKALQVSCGFAFLNSGSFNSAASTLVLAFEDPAKPGMGLSVNFNVGYPNGSPVGKVSVLWQGTTLATRDGLTFMKASPSQDGPVSGPPSAFCNLEFEVSPDGALKVVLLPADEGTLPLLLVNQTINFITTPAWHFTLTGDVSSPIPGVGITKVWSLNLQGSTAPYLVDPLTNRSSWQDFSDTFNVRRSRYQ